MTDPKEFNSIDKLFRDTFSSLPDSPAPNGWDTPSEQVWTRIRREIGFAAAGTDRNGRWMLAAITVGIVVAGMYLLLPTGADTKNEKSDASGMPSASQVIAAESPALKDDIPTSTPTLANNAPAVMKRSTSPVLPVGLPSKGEFSASGPMKGAAPLPGTANPAAPNTTEERKAALEQLWRTPLSMLPVPRR